MFDPKQSTMTGTHCAIVSAMIGLPSARRASNVSKSNACRAIVTMVRATPIDDASMLLLRLLLPTDRNASGMAANCTASKRMKRKVTQLAAFGATAADGRSIRRAAAE